ncbi:hypothetical protein NDU88_005607 [Pleurodeles waltl]|uniref:Uncharacterized protein n=1 Tax=Pleurodeles waltl TaxID=8319 RepID=A0AAV7MCL5_PLEWA|nr:hypothetical protein NDU88_005607 [Pleurodeles waltl]
MLSPTRAAASARGPERGPGGLRPAFPRWLGEEEGRLVPGTQRSPLWTCRGGREAPWEHWVAARSGRGAAATGVTREAGAVPAGGERSGKRQRCPDGESGDGACLMPLPDLNMAPKDRP